jgi:hypothetical protein
MTTAVKTVEDVEGAVGVLVDNAGYKPRAAALARACDASARTMIGLRRVMPAALWDRSMRTSFP